tara:strand:+ start:343 stop:2952 length:2610 start_codon:yes stop_codon:yes gene_type:complete
MAIIYSYPKETNPQPTDLLIGTSTVTVDGKQSNVTRSYSLQTITDYIKTLGGVGVQSITFNTPLTGGTITNTGTVSIPQADNVTDGYLSSADWNTFNDKLGGISGTQYKIPIWSTTSALGNSSLTETGGGTTITSDKTFAPSGDNTKDLGVTSTARWKDAFLAGTVSTANITMTGTLSANGSTGTSGYVLQSKGAGTPVEWLDLTTVADKYDLSVATSGSDANLNLTSTSTGDDSQVKIKQGSNINISVISPTEVEISANTQGSVTNVSSTDPNTISIVNNTTTPEITAVTTGGVGASNTNLVTGDQVQTAIDNALIGSVEFKGGFNAGTGAIDSGGNLTTGASRVAIAVGDLYVVTTAGDFYGSVPLGVGDQVICKTAASVGASTVNDWTTVESNVVPATAGATDAGTTKGVASFDNQMFAATTDGFITSTTLNSINITVGGGVFVVDGNSQEDMYLARGTTFFINQDDATNNNHPLVISTTSPSTTVYNTGVVYLLDNVVTAESDWVNTTNFNAATTRRLRVTLQQGSPTLYYTCYIHGAGMGGNIYATATGAGVTQVSTGNGLTGGPITGTGTISPDYTTANNIVLAAPSLLSSAVDNDKLLINDSTAGNAVKEITLSTIKTYIGAGTGTVTGSGTANKVAKWSSGSAIADSNVEDTGSLVTISSAGKITGDLELDADLIDVNGGTGSAGQLLSSLGGGGAGVDWIDAPISYEKWIVSDGSNNSDVSNGNTVTFTTGTSGTSTGANDAISVTESSKTVTIVSNAFDGEGKVGHVPDATGNTSNFLRGDGQWAAAGGGSIVKDEMTASANQTVFTGLSQAPTDINYVNVFVSGVYQNKSAIASVSGTTVTLQTGVPAGTKVEFVTSY